MAPISMMPAGGNASKHAHSIEHTVTFKRAAHTPCKWRRSLFIVVPAFASDGSAAASAAADADDRIVWGNLDTDTISSPDNAVDATTLEADAWLDSAIVEWEVPCAHARGSGAAEEQCATEDETEWTGDEGYESTDNEADFTSEDSALQFLDAGRCAHAQDDGVDMDSFRYNTCTAAQDSARYHDGLWLGHGDSPHESVATYAATGTFGVCETCVTEDEYMSMYSLSVSAVAAPPATD